MNEFCRSLISPGPIVRTWIVAIMLVASPQLGVATLRWHW